jgi:hypothetical protein
MKKLVLSLMVVCLCAAANSQNILNFSVVSILQNDQLNIDSATRAFIDAQPAEQETDSVFEAYAKKYTAVDDYRKFLTHTWDNGLDGLCFSAHMDYGRMKMFKSARFGQVYNAIVNSPGGTYAKEKVKYELVYSISKNFNSFNGMGAIIGKKKISEKQYSTLYNALTEKQREAQALLFSISVAYNECLAALDLQQIPDADRIAIKHALFVATPRITNL